MAKRSLMDDIRQHLPRKGVAPWFTTIDADLQAELESIRADFHAGRLGPGVTKTGLSHAVAKSLQQRGIQIGHSGVQRWLTEH